MNIFSKPRWLFLVDDQTMRLNPLSFLPVLVTVTLLAGCASAPVPLSEKPLSTASASAIATSHPRCLPNPLGTRDLYLRGSFNGWAAGDTQKMTYQCNRFELVTKINGEHKFKVGDEEWSQDADFGIDPAQVKPPWRLGLLGRNGNDIRYIFSGNHKLTLNMTDAKTPTLDITTCDAPPLGQTTLYLRGAMNNWTALDDYAFQFSCDAYYLNVNLQGRYEFKIADAALVKATTFGNDGSGKALETDRAEVLLTAEHGTNGNLSFDFKGTHTIRLAYAGNRPVVTIGAKTFADPKAIAVTNPLALSLNHDSRSLRDKSPFGAVTAGTKVNFNIGSDAGVGAVTIVIEKRRMEGNQDTLEYTEVARLPLTRTHEAEKNCWLGTFTFNEIGVYGYYFEAMVKDSGNEKTYIYQNNRDSIYWTREKGSNGVGVVDEKPASTKAIRRFRHTVYAKDFVVPSWAKDAVYYYIFPERFRNGNKINDPKPGVTTYQDKGVEFHQNWLDKPYRPKSGDGSDDVYNNDFFGGDLAGIIEKLDYIADLGANTIYMTPIFQASSNHKYDTADYKKIDPHFGTNADFERLTREAAKRDIRVIPDASLNHTGSDSIYFDRYGKYGKGGANGSTGGAFANAKINPQSPYASWYKFDASQTDPNKQYKGWVDVTDLPELDKSSPAFREFAYGAKDSVMKLWLDRGAAGWRMDVVPWVPDDFWREWRTAIKQHKPDALTISETWFDSSKYFLGDEFDTTMNYIFRNTVIDYANGGKARALYQNLELIREAYPPQSFYALMNLVSSHDVARALHLFGDEAEKSSPEKITLAKQRLRLATFFQMTYPGAPAIYYGDEVGVTGGDDPYNRATYPWQDLGGKPDWTLLANVKALTRLRHHHAVFRHGSLDAPLYIDDNVIVLLRRLDNSVAITATNNATTPQTVQVALPAGIGNTVYVDALNGNRIHATEGTISITVPALFGVALVSQ